MAKQETGLIYVLHLSPLMVREGGMQKWRRRRHISIQLSPVSKKGVVQLHMPVLHYHFKYGRREMQAMKTTLPYQKRLGICQRLTLDNSFSLFRADHVR